MTLPDDFPISFLASAVPHGTPADRWLYRGTIPKSEFPTVDCYNHGIPHLVELRPVPTCWPSGAGVQRKNIRLGRCHCGTVHWGEE